MPRQASFDVERFETQIIETILHSPVALSRRAIFDKCDFDNSNRAMVTCFDRLNKQPRFEMLIDSHGENKYRVYISKNPPKPINRSAPQIAASEPSPVPPPVKTPKETPKEKARPPKPTFTVKDIADASGVTDALNALRDASGDDGLVALGVDKRAPEKDRAFKEMMLRYKEPFPLRRIILAAGDIVYDFDIRKIVTSVYARSDNDNIKGFAPFRDFFADHTVVSHDSLSTCAPLVALDIPLCAMQETRLAVRMLQDQAGVSGDDSFNSSVGYYLKHIPYSRPDTITGSILPLFRELRGRLVDELTTFETFCRMLPILASGQKPFLLSLRHPDLLDCEDLPLIQQVHATFELLGDGGIQLELSIGPTADVQRSSSFGSPSPVSLSKKMQWWSDFSMIVTVRFGSEAQLCQCLSVLPALASHPVVFDYNDPVPERMAIFLMRTIEGVVDDAQIRLRLGDGCNDFGSGKALVGWRDEWWSEWVDLASADVMASTG